MLGAGVFSAVAPAAEAAGTLLLAGLALAAAVAYANATSSAQLAARYPKSGATHVYAGERLGRFWGFLAGWSFVIGKTASLAAMALTFGAYLFPALARPLGLAALAVLSALDYRGVEKTARASMVLVGVVVATLALIVAAALLGAPNSSVAPAGSSPAPAGWYGVLRSAAILFFAFAGYARIATLGEEVADPKTTIPRAIPLALGLTVVIYAAVMGAALVAAGPDEIAASDAPLARVVELAGWQAALPFVRLGAAAACCGVLISLLAGVSRTVLSLARRRELPEILSAVHPRFKTPHRAQLTVAAVVGAVVLLTDLRHAIGFSSFAVLTYYALTNCSALTLPSSDRRWPSWLAAFGLAGCVLLAIALPATATVPGLILLAAGSVAWLADPFRRTT
jgi:APA family basic amino acid/polyamine antiporter